MGFRSWPAELQALHQARLTHEEVRRSPSQWGFWTKLTPVMEADMLSHVCVCVCVCMCVCVLVTQSCLILCNPMDCSPPGSSVHGILQARILEWAAISSSRGSSQPRDRTQVACMAGGFFII